MGVLMLIAMLFANIFANGHLFVFAESEQPTAPANIEHGSIYKIDVSLKRTGTTENSMANIFLDGKGEAYITNDGKAIIKLHLIPNQVPGTSGTFNANDLKVYKEGSKTEFIESSFGMDDEKDAIFTTTLGQIKNVYPAKVFSGVMDNNVDLNIDWENATKVENYMTELYPTIQKTMSYEATDYTKESYDSFNETFNEVTGLFAGEQPTNEGMFMAHIKLIQKIKKLQKKPAMVLPIDSTYYADVNTYLEDLRQTLNYEAKIVTDSNGVTRITLSFEPVKNKYGDKFYVSSMEFLNKKHESVKQETVLTGEHKGTHTFEAPYIDNKGEYTLLLGMNGGEPNEVAIRIDWETKRTGADFRPLSKAVDEAGQKDKTKYTEKSYNKLMEIVEMAKSVLANADSSREAVKEATIKVEKAIEDLLFIENEGHGKLFNIGTSGLGNPYKTDEQKDIPWAGSKVIFGKGNLVWKVLDPEKGILMLDKPNGKAAFSDPSKYSEPNGWMGPWETSTIRGQLNGEFYNETFSDAEKSIIKNVESKLCYNHKQLDGTIIETKCNTTVDKVTLPTIALLSNKEYGFYNNSTRMFGAKFWTMEKSNVNIINGKPSDIGSVDMYDVQGEYRGGASASEENLIFPVIQIDMSKVMMTKVADFDSNSPIMKSEPTKDNLWKLTVKDESKTVAVKDLSKKGNVITGKYTTNLENGQLSLMIKRAPMMKTTFRSVPSDEYVYYGKASIDNENIRFELPADFNEDTDVVMVFAETADAEGVAVGSEPEVIDVNKISEAKDDAMDKVDTSAKDKGTTVKTIKKVSTVDAVKTGDSSEFLGFVASMVAAMIALILLNSRKSRV